MNRHDPDAGLEPAFAAPANACDAHFHVFGAAAKYPYGSDIRYKPPFEPIERYLELARRIGFVRHVFVQPSAYGFDNSCMLDSMRQLDPAIRRGIIDLDENNTSDRELADLDATGVRGIRVNISPIRQPEAGLAASMLPRIARLTGICEELGWHLDFLTPGWLVSELMPALHELPVAFSVAPCRMPKIVLRPSWLIPKAATICWPANGVASISNAHSFSLSSRRSIISFNFVRLASMKCSLIALFSKPYASLNWRTA